MKFKTISAKLRKIEKGDNIGQLFLECVHRESNPFAVKSHKRTYFIPQDSIPEWEEYIAKNQLPSIDADYVVVNDLPLHYVLNDAEERVGQARSSMVILVLVNAKGEPREDARTIALRIIDQMMELADGHGTEVKNDTVIPPAVVVVPPAVADAPPAG